MDIIYNKEANGEYSVFITIPNFLDSKEQIDFLNNLQAIEDWKGGEFFGNSISRLQKWYHDDGNYFSKKWVNQDIQRWKSHEHEQWLLELRKKVQLTVNRLFETELEKFSGCNKPSINSSLLNFYRDGSDFINYHKDDEQIFGDNPSVAMLAFGQERYLDFKRIINTNKQYPLIFNKEEESMDKSFLIKPGSLFIMMGAVQKYYCHGVKKNKNISDPRYSVTFREQK